MSNRIVNQGAPALTAAVGANLPAACVTTNFHGHLLLDQSIVWIPDPLSPVDQAVMDLVALVDRSAQQPAKLVMWSVPGTADDAEPAQVATWYGQQGPNLVQAHQYAIKMIDELELPYTIVRTPPLTAGAGGQVVAEGVPLTPDPVGIDRVAAVIAAAATPTRFLNQSVGIKGGD